MLETCEFTVSVTKAEVLAFAELSGDFNPLHVDEDYAAGTEYRGPIAHGALMLSYVSRVLGMYIPGTECVILSMRARFPQPLRYPAQLLIRGSLASVDEAGSRGRVRVIGEVVGTGAQVLDSQVDFTTHIQQPAPTTLQKATSVDTARDPSALPRVLITGGTGPLGRDVITSLAGSYRFTCLTRRVEVTGTGPGASYVQVDLDDANELQMFLASAFPSEYHAIVHLSSLPADLGFASDGVEATERQLRHSVLVPLELTRWARQPQSSVRRVVLVGSQYATRRPQAKMGSYSVAKAAMEALAPVLVADLSGQSATVNVIAVGPTGTGMSSGLSPRARATAESHSASGRLTSGADLGQLVEFLLSDSSDQINGAVIPLDGGLIP